MSQSAGEIHSEKGCSPPCIRQLQQPVLTATCLVYFCVAVCAAEVRVDWLAGGLDSHAANKGQHQGACYSSNSSNSNGKHTGQHLPADRCLHVDNARRYSRERSSPGACLYACVEHSVYMCGHPASTPSSSCVIVMSPNLVCLQVVGGQGLLAHDRWVEVLRRQQVQCGSGLMV